MAYLDADYQVHDQIGLEFILADLPMQCYSEIVPHFIELPNRIQE